MNMVRYHPGGGIGQLSFGLGQLQNKSTKDCP